MKATAFSVAVSAGFLTVTIYCIRKRYLKELHAVLWLALSLLAVLMSLLMPFRPLDRVSRFLGIAYPPDLAWFLGIVTLFLLVLELTISQSRILSRQTKLIQEMAIELESRKKLTEDPD
jgi:hypothetical protein